MMLTALWLFSAGFITGLGAWWFSLDRRRGKEVRELAHAHDLHVDEVHEASARALRYGFAEDFTFMVKKAHPRVGDTNVPVLRPQGSTDGKEDPSFIKEE